MQNFIQEGKILTLTAPYDRTSGQGAQVGAIFGVATTTVTSGNAAEFLVEGVVSLVKATGAVSVGDLIYWDDSAKNCTKTATAGRLIGAATAAAQSGDANVTVRLNEAVSTLAQGKQAAITALTDAFGTPGNTIVDVTGTPTQTTINNNFASQSAKINAIISALQAAGILT